MRDRDMRAAESAPLRSILPAGEGDIPLIIALARHIWPRAYRDILTAEQIANMLERIYEPAQLRQEMADGHRFLIAYMDASPAGYVSAYREHESSIWIKKLYVDPAAQRQGVGRALIEAAVAAMGLAEEVKLLVNPNNLPAQRYYAHVGFAPAGTLPVRMGDFHFEDIIFRKPLLDGKN